LQTLFRQLIPICLVMAVPIIPFFLFGNLIEDWISQVENSSWLAGIVILLLSGDIFLPIPSSVVSTFTGGQMHWITGTLVSWIGMNIGAVLGFWFASKYGRSFALRFSQEEDLQRAAGLTHRFGPGFLVLARGVPVLAEASVLLMGVHELSWRRFLLPIILSNLGISLAYSAFGHIARKHDWFPLAMGISIGVPVLLTLVVQRFVKIKAESPVADSDTLQESELDD